MIRARLCTFILWLFAAMSANAHEVRPAYLSATEITPAVFDISWKQPVPNGKRLRLSPAFDPACATTVPRRRITAADSLTEVWQIDCDLKSGSIEFAGLEGTLTDIFVQIEYLSGDPKSVLVRPDNPRLNLAGPAKSPAKAYLGIGIEHVAFGWDHLLFIIGLTLLVMPRQIIGVATAFTLAHSLTLPVTAMGWINLPSRPVEILIAASIVLLAVEIMRKRAGKSSPAMRRPWIIAGVIGLIHGLGFADALADIGLPKGQELWALLLFNIGVEIGQVAVIIAALLILWGLHKISRGGETAARLITTYCIGAMGAFWMIGRLAQYVA